MAVTYLKIMSIPWVSTGSLDRAGGSLDRPGKIALEQASGQNVYNSEPYSLCLTGAYNSSVPSTVGPYTQRIPIYAQSSTVNQTEGRLQEVMSLWVLDSMGGYSCSGSMQGKSCIPKDAISWFNNEVLKSASTVANDVLFTTYPLQEFMQIANNCSFYGQQQ